MLILSVSNLMTMSYVRLWQKLEVPLLSGELQTINFARDIAAKLFSCILVQLIVRPPPPLSLSLSLPVVLHITSFSTVLNRGFFTSVASAERFEHEKLTFSGFNHISSYETMCGLDKVHLYMYTGRFV